MIGAHPATQIMDAVIPLHDLKDNWLTVVMIVVVAWLVVTRLVESHDALAKTLGPLGRRIQDGYRRSQVRYRSDVADEAKLLAVELLPKVMPSDYAVVKGQLHNVIDRVEDLELENQALRAFIVEDEEWHFRLSLAVATVPDVEHQIQALPTRYTWTEFLANWRTGWRPRNNGTW